MATAAGSYLKRKAHFTLIWRIESCLVNEELESPTFTVQSMEMTEWRLVLEIYDSSVYFWIRREVEDGGPESIEIESELSILDDGGSTLVEKSIAGGHFRKGEDSDDIECIETALFDKKGDHYFLKDPLTVRYRMWRKGTEMSKSELCFARTRFDVHRLSCVWAVKDFSSLKQGEKRTRILNTVEKGFPQLSLIISLAQKNDEEYVFIHLENTEVLYCSFLLGEIAVLDGEGVAAHFKLVEKLTSPQIDTELYALEKSKLTDALLSDDVLLLRCELKLYPSEPSWSRIEDYKLMDYWDSEQEQSEKSGSHFHPVNKTAVCPFKQIINTFKEETTLSDVSLRAGTKTFAVHKLVLSSRSPVFRAMFTQDMREKTSKCIDIPDMDADTLGRLLSYIYGDEVAELTWETATNLFEAADKYELLDLKEICSCFLKYHLSESNVCKILVLADMDHDDGLRKSAQEFIQNNTEIMRSDVWKAFRDDHSKLAWETAEYIICNIKHTRP